MNKEALKHIQEWKELNDERDVNSKIWTSIGLLRRDLLIQDKIWENIDDLDRKIGSLRKFLPQLVRILNKNKDVELWRNNQNLWVLKEFNDGMMTFSRTSNGKEESVKISKKLFDRIKDNDFEGFSVKLKRKSVREYIFNNGEVELSESFINYVRNFKPPINLPLDRFAKQDRREKILQMLKNGKRNKDISEKIGIHPACVTRYKKRFQKEGLL